MKQSALLYPVGNKTSIKYNKIIYRVLIKNTALYYNNVYTVVQMCLDNIKITH